MVAVGVGDAGEAVAVELVGGFGDGGGAGGQGLGVDGVAVGDVEVDQSAGGRVLGRQGVGEHQDGPAYLDLGVTDAAFGHGHTQALDGSETADEEVDESGGALDDEVWRDGGVAVGDGLDVGHGGSCGCALAFRARVNEWDGKAAVGPMLKGIVHRRGHRVRRVAGSRVVLPLFTLILTPSIDAERESENPSAPTR